MSLRTILLGDGGPGAALGAALTVGFGLVLVVSGAIDLGEAFRKAPQPMACATLLREPVTGRWLALSDCRLDVLHARLERADGGGAERYSVPLQPATAAVLPERSRGDGGLGLSESPLSLVARDAELVALASQLEALPSAQAQAALDAAPDQLKTRLRPERLVGHLVPHAERYVLEQGKPTPAGKSLLAFFLGTALLAWAFAPVAIRVLLSRER